jgi:hypothetical protein
LCSIIKYFCKNFNSSLILFITSMNTMWDSFANYFSTGILKRSA